MTGSVLYHVPVEVSGPTGAVAATRYAGGTATGAPASGSFLKGDFVVAQDGHIWVCTAAGSPGTWVDAGTFGSPSFATPAIVLGTAAAGGVASTVIRSDATIVAFDATVPSTQAIGDSAAAGSAAVAARRDHKHAMPAFATNAILLDSSAAAGSAATLVRSDATIAAFDATVPTTQAFGDAAAIGTAAFAARRDHKHAFPSLGTGATNACAGNDSRLSDRRIGKEVLQSYSGIIAESIPRIQHTSTVAALSTGRLTSMSIPVLAGQVITSASLYDVTQSAVNPTNWWFAITDASLNVIRQSTDQLATAWSSSSFKTLALDSVPVTAGARVASSTVTLTFPTLSQALSALFTVGDSIVVSNANIAAYNGTFTVASVGASTITYVSGGSATDSLAAPFPTVQMAAGKRTYTMPADGLLYGVVMMKAGTVVNLMGSAAGSTSGLSGTAPVFFATGQSSLTGTCPSPITQSGATPAIWIGLS